MTAARPAISDGDDLDPRAMRRLARAPTLVIALGCAVAAIYLGLGASDAARVDRASELGAAGQFAASAAQARAVSTEPSRARAAVIEAYALVEKGDDKGAAPVFARAAEADPANWVVRRDWASALLRIKRVAAARAQMGMALALNPLIVLPPEFARAPSKP